MMTLDRICPVLYIARILIVINEHAMESNSFCSMGKRYITWEPVLRAYNNIWRFGASLGCSDYGRGLGD